MASKRFSDAWLRSLAGAPEGKRQEWLDEGGTGLLVSVNGKRPQRITFWLIARFPGSDGALAKNPSRAVLGDYRPDDTKGRDYVIKKGVPSLTLSEARTKAESWKSEIKAGRDPRPKKAAAASVSAGPAPDTVGAIFVEYEKRHVLKEGQKDGRGKPVPALRSAGEIKRIFDRYVLADLDGNERWRDRSIMSIKRRDVTELLDLIEDQNGATQANAVLAQLSSLFNWYAARGDDFVSPIVRGMKRSKPKERARERILDDTEIATLWEASAGQGSFGALCRIALLTGQRREKITQMQWDHISADGLWTIETESREKTNAEYLRLPKLALDIIRAQPRTPSRPYVFQGRLKGPINGFSKAKVQLDSAMEKIAVKPIQPWVLHDLRRTAKTLMIRAGVSPHDSERVLGHAIPGVEGVYDRHGYLAEKTAALKKLSSLVARIVKPRDNVVSMERATKRG